jgi:hypothetical protein
MLEFSRWLKKHQEKRSELISRHRSGPQIGLVVFLPHACDDPSPALLQVLRKVSDRISPSRLATSERCGIAFDGSGFADRGRRLPYVERRIVGRFWFALAANAPLERRCGIGRSVELLDCDANPRRELWLIRRRSTGRVVKSGLFIVIVCVVGESRTAVESRQRSAFGSALCHP